MIEQQNSIKLKRFDNCVNVLGVLHYLDYLKIGILKQQQQKKRKYSTREHKAVKVYPEKKSN